MQDSTCCASLPCPPDISGPCNTCIPFTAPNGLHIATQCAYSFRCAERDPCGADGNCLDQSYAAIPGGQPTVAFAVCDCTGGYSGTFCDIAPDGE